MTTEITVFNEFKAQLAELKSTNATLVFDYESKEGNKAARSHIAKLRKSKAAIESKRKEEKAGILEQGKAIDGAAKEIAEQIQEMIEHHKTPLDEIEKKDEARKANIQSNIQAIREMADVGNMPSQVILGNLETVRDVQIDSSFGEFLEDAVRAKEEAAEKLSEAYDQRKTWEAEQAELNALRREKVEREKQEQEEALKRKAEEEAREKVEAEKRQAERIEQEKRDAIEAERDRIEEERLRKEADESARRVNKSHREKIKNEVISGLSDKEFCLNAHTSLALFRAISEGKIPHVSIQY